MNTIVFYDIIDNDGRGARAVFELAHKDRQDIKYIGLDRDMLYMKSCHYLDFVRGFEFEEDIDIIYFLDLAPRNKDEAMALKDASILVGCNKVVVIDHHKLKYRIFDYVFEYVYGDGVSACMLTWKYFFTSPPPYVVELINDRDVWLNKMQPHTNLFHNVSGMMNQQELQDVISQTMNKDYTSLNHWLNVGRIREKSNQREILMELKTIKFSTILGVKVAYMDKTVSYEILSELGNRACMMHIDKADAFVHVVYSTKKSKWTYNLRSLNGQALKIITDNNLDGGGHDNACGFKSDIYLMGT